MDPACRYRFADGTTLDMPHDPAAIPAALDAALGPGTGASWQALHDRSARLWDLVGDAVLRRPLDGVGDLLRFSRRVRDLRMIAPWRTLRGLGTAMLPDPRMRAWFDRYATYSGSDPRRTPSVLSVTPYVEQRFGAWYVRGGLRRIADALLARCVALGVRVHLDSLVIEVCTDRWGVTEVRLADGGVVSVDAVVCDADASGLYGGLVRGRAGARVGRSLLRAQPSLSGFTLLLALDGYEPGPAHRVFFPADYDAEFDAVLGRVPPRWPTRRSTYTPPTTRPCAPTAPPRAGSCWSTPRRTTRAAASTGTHRAGPRATPTSCWPVSPSGGADVRDRIRWREVFTPADLERATGAPGGAIYGTASHGPRAALLRPANRSPVSGLYLVGGSAHPGGGLPLVVLSAAIVADMIGSATEVPPIQ